MLRVVHVSPTYFAPESVLGGGERFAEELARAMAKTARVRFVSFGPRRHRSHDGERYERIILRNWTGRKWIPFSPWLRKVLRDADVIHCHQLHFLSTFVAAFLGHRRGARVFATDLGGGAWTPAYQIDQTRWLSGLLPISQYAARGLPPHPPHRVIYAGVDLERFRMRERSEHDGSIVFLGRILRHKGIHLAIAGLPEGMLLRVVGQVSDPEYRRELEELARERSVSFHHDLADDQVVAILQRAMALVHATPVDQQGNAGVNELFGLAPAEAMACGCPVVASSVASLPEVIGDTGLLIPPNSPDSIRGALLRLRADDAEWRERSRAARARIESCFTWGAVAQRCLQAYEELSVHPARVTPRDRVRA